MTVAHAPDRTLSTEQERQGLAGLLARATVEVTQKSATKIASFAETLPAGTVVYVTHLEGTDFAESVAIAKRLRDDGMIPHPHLAARNIPTRAALDTWLDQLVDVGVDRLLLLAGGAARAAGPFPHSMAVLDTGRIAQAGIKILSVAGHPEGHPNADARTLRAALEHKMAYAQATGTALSMTTQFTFSFAPVAEWLRGLAADGLTVPVQIGAPGPATPKTLIKIAMESGVGASLQVLTKRPDLLGMLVRRWTPDELLRAAGRYFALNPDGLLAGIHFYPFGGFARTAAWLRALQAGEVDLARDGKGLVYGPAADAALKA